QEPFGRRRNPFDVDRLCRTAADAIAELLKQRRAAAPASTEEHRDPGRRSIERRDYAARQCRTRRQHPFLTCGNARMRDNVRERIDLKKLRAPCQFENEK